MGMPATQPPWNEQLKGSQGILTITGVTVQKGRIKTTLLVSLSSTPTIFPVAAKALLKLGPRLWAHPPSHSDLNSDYYLLLPSCSWLQPSWNVVSEDLACPCPLGVIQKSRVLLQCCGPKGPKLSSSGPWPLPSKELSVHTVARNVGTFLSNPVPPHRRED